MKKSKPLTILKRLSSACLLGIFVLTILSVINLRSFHRLTHEELIAELAIESSSAQTYIVRLFMNDHAPQSFELHGDEWQLDARIIKWKPWLNVLGLHTLYRLERLATRYQNPVQAQHQPYSIISLNDPAATESLADMYNWLPIVDAYYGNSTFMPLGHGARYRIAITTSGIIARPMNDSAEALLRDW